MLYHVTYLHALPGIQAHGLQPGGGQNFGMGYAAYSRGWLFLTSYLGVVYWATNLEQQALGLTDNPEEGWVPVVLAVSEDDVEEDDEGTRDASAQAWKTREAIDPEDIQVWWDGEWHDLEDVDHEDMLEDALDMSEYVDEDGGYWEMVEAWKLTPDREAEE